MAKMGLSLPSINQLITMAIALVVLFGIISAIAPANVKKFFTVR